MAVPFLALAIIHGEFREAAVLVLVAGVTDALDGFLARGFGWVTKMGAYLDPVADKLLLVTSYLALGSRGIVPEWLVWLVLGRDAVILAMVGAAFVFTTVRSFPPSIWGKISTLFQVSTAAVLILDQAFLSGSGHWWDGALMGATVFFTSFSGLHYIFRAVRQLSSQK